MCITASGDAQPTKGDWVMAAHHRMALRCRAVTFDLARTCAAIWVVNEKSEKIESFRGPVSRGFRGSRAETDLLAGGAGGLEVRAGSPSAQLVEEGDDVGRRTRSTGVSRKRSRNWGAPSVTSPARRSSTSSGPRTTSEVS